MPVKYECPKCGRRFAEWGAEKMGFHCPVDEWCPKDASEDIQFVKAGSAEAGGRAPSLKRRPRKPAVVAAPVEHVEDEAVVPDIEEADDIDVDAEEDVEVEEEDEVVVKGADDETVEVAEEEPVIVGETAEVEFGEEELDESEEAEEATEEEDWA
jgi:hypothetical protein